MKSKMEDITEIHAVNEYVFNSIKDSLKGMGYNSQHIGNKLIISKGGEILLEITISIQKITITKIMLVKYDIKNKRAGRTTHKKLEAQLKEDVPKGKFFEDLKKQTYTAILKDIKSLLF